MQLTEGLLPGGYNYLLSMALWSLTKEKVDKLRAELEAKTAELNTLEAKDAADLWCEDLDALEAALEAVRRVGMPASLVASWVAHRWRVLEPRLRVCIEQFDEETAAEARAESAARKRYGKGKTKAKPRRRAAKPTKSVASAGGDSDSDFVVEDLTPVVAAPKPKRAGRLPRVE